MENTENTPNPGSVEDTVREENSSAVNAEPIENSPLPTESNQTEQVTTEEFHAELVPPLADDQGDHEDHEDHEEELAAEHESHEEKADYDQKSRSELIDILEKVVQEDDINAIKTTIALIKVAFLKKKKEESLLKYEAALGQEGETKEELPPEQDELDVKFNEFFNVYKANKARFVEEQEKLKHENLKKKLLIIEELKQLIASEETLKKTYDEFKTLQERWKNVGI